jgi:hypothetical protein
MVKLMLVPLLLLLLLFCLSCAGWTATHLWSSARA